MVQEAVPHAGRAARRCAVALFAVWSGLAAGCASAGGPQVLRIESRDYHAAFDAAVEAGRSHGMPPSMRDRRRGVVQTEPSISGSFIEPWRGAGDSWSERLENTLSFQRRRARFEFSPAGFRPAEPQAEPLTGPDLFGTRTPPVDLPGHEGPLELRVWVFIERASAPGLRRRTWTRRKTTRTIIVRPETGEVVPAVFWTPVARDPDLERRLLADVIRRLERRREG